MLRTIVFFDGQNLYHGAKDAWRQGWSGPGCPYTWPSYDVEKLAAVLVSTTPGRVLSQIRFYTGVPDPERGKAERFWHGFWSNKLRRLINKGIYVYKGRINPAGHEKGVDVSIAIDLIQLTYERVYEVAIIVSQDWDLGPAIRLARRIASEQGRELVFESAFAYGPGTRSKRGIPGTKWIKLDQSTYDACLDTVDDAPFNFRDP